MDNYTCQKCGLKQSRAAGREVYVEVHHVHRVSEESGWQELIEAVRRYLLVDPKELETLCVDCHAKEGKEDQCQ